MYQTVLLVAALSATPAQGYSGCSGSSSVRHVTASVTGGNVVVQEFSWVYQETTQNFILPIKGTDGKIEQVPQTIKIVKLVPIAVQRPYDAAKVRFLDNDGKKVAPAEALRQLEKETPVVATFEGWAVNPDYLGILKKGTLVLILPLELPPPPPGKPLAPPPFPKKEETSLEAEPRFFVGARGPKSAINPPGGPAPILVRASIDDKGVAHIHETSGGTDYVKVKMTKDFGGVLKEVDAKMTVARTLLTKKSLSAEWVKGYGVDSKEIDAKVLTEKLRKPVTVLMSADGKVVDPYYLQVIKDGTIIIVSPVPNHYHGVMPIAPKKEMPRREEKLPVPKT